MKPLFFFILTILLIVLFYSPAKADNKVNVGTTIESYLYFFEQNGELRVKTNLKSGYSVQKISQYIFPDFAKNNNSIVDQSLLLTANF